MKKLVLLAAIALQLGVTRAALADEQVSLKRIARITSPAYFMPYFNNAQRVAQDSTGNKIATTVTLNDETSLYVYDLVAKERRTIFKAFLSVDSIEMTRDGNLILITAGNNSRGMALINLKKGTLEELPISNGSGVKGHIQQAHISPDGKFIAYTIESRVEERTNVFQYETLLMDVATKESKILLSAFEQSESGIDEVINVSDEGRYLLLEHSEKYGGDRRRLLQLDTTNLQIKEVDSIPLNTRSKNYGVTSAVQSRDGRFIAFAQVNAEQRKIQRRDTTTGLLTTIKCPQLGATAILNSYVSMSDNGDILIAAYLKEANDIAHQALIARVDQSSNSCKVIRRRTSRAPIGKYFVSDLPYLSPNGTTFTYIRSLIDRYLNYYREELIVGAFKK